MKLKELLPILDFEYHDALIVNLSSDHDTGVQARHQQSLQKESCKKYFGEYEVITVYIEFNTFRIVVVKGE